MVGMHDTYVQKRQQGENFTMNMGNYNIGINALLRNAKSKYPQRTLSIKH